ncbi:MAG: family 20 glycosylhydrolase, partial [Bacteroidaceae bacterium]|nr:family 20 glycosylhydrolase [Bacteroidaceae bacterium]
AGWRMEIKKYPLLTSVAAWRPFASWQAWWDSDRRYCTATDANAYGGYYTQDECREVVRYAAERHITVIPEIEMPGHSEEVMAVYPECSCSGEAYKNNEFCPGKETTFRFLEDVLTEVMDVFPSHYIHIGGDEAEKTAWHTCPACQRRMTTEHLTDVDQLQSYLIQRIERFVNSRGRSIIGWDEILQGGLSPNATVMSWRGEEGGIRAAQLGHDVIMTPGSHCYFDSYQDAPHTQPKAMGGFLTLEKVYSYNPLPAALTAEQGRHVLGVQANLWTEHIPTPEHADYMIWPRLLALSEVAWSAPERKEWTPFRQLALRESACLRQLGHHPFDLATEVGERRQAQQPVEHRARGCNVTYNQAFSPYYPAGGPAALVDGHCGGWTHTDGTWQGFVGRDLDVTLDLGRRQKVSEIEITFMQNIQAWIHLPAEVFVDVSADGQRYRQAAVLRPDIDEAENYRLATLRARINAPRTRFIRLRATKPERKGGWLFTDEIILR